MRHMVETPNGPVDVAVPAGYYIAGCLGTSCMACLAIVAFDVVVHAAGCEWLKPIPIVPIAPEHGDRVDVAPHRKDVYGVRVGVVTLVCEPSGVFAGRAWVEIPGGEEWLVRFEHITVVWRAPTQEQP